jgi:hypothetical protein
MVRGQTDVPGVKARRTSVQFSRQECEIDIRDWRAVELRKTIGLSIGMKLLRSMANDIGIWTKNKCPPGWTQNASLLLFYLGLNMPLIAKEWAARKFTVQNKVALNATSSCPQFPVDVQAETIEKEHLSFSKSLDAFYLSDDLAKDRLLSGDVKGTMKGSASLHDALSIDGGFPGFVFS